MSTTLDTVKGAAATMPDGVRVTPTSLEIDDTLDFEAWADLGGRLGLLGSSWQWWIGDWLVEGHSVYGKRYEEARISTGLAYQSLADLKYVCSRLDFSRRRENLSFQHHREVAALDATDQERWLTRAERANLSVSQLRDGIARERSNGRPAFPIRFSLSLPPTQAARAERWRHAADRAELEFSEWAAQALDHACEDIIQ